MHGVTCNGRTFIPGKIICVGKNYPDHIREMGGGATPAEPAIFIKPNSAISFCEDEIFVSQTLGLLHHECELCFIAGRSGKAVSEGEALKMIAGFAVGIDFTLRERQALAKKSGGPWALAKGFDASAVFGEFLPEGSIENPLALDILLKVNGEVRQSSNTREMIFTPTGILSFVSIFMTIEEGDIFMCGTPAGVGPVEDGDVLDASVGAMSLHVKVNRSHSGQR